MKQLSTTAYTLERTFSTGDIHKSIMDAHPRIHEVFLKSSDLICAHSSVYVYGYDNQYAVLNIWNQTLTLKLNMLESHSYHKLLKEMEEN